MASNPIPKIGQNVNSINRLTPSKGIFNSFGVRVADFNNLVDRVNSVITDAGLISVTTNDIADGTATAPSLAFASDTDTGIYSAGANDIGITVGGTLRFDISSTLATLALPISVTNATDSTSGSTGAIYTAGGIGATKAIYSGSTVTGTTSVLTPGVDAIAAGALTIGAATATSVAITPATNVVGNLTVNTNKVSITASSGAAEFLGAVTHPVGAVDTPSITFRGLANSQGFYSVSGTQLGVSTGGALHTLFDGSGIMSDSVRARVEPGTVGAGTVVASSYGDGKNFVTVLTLTNFIVGALAGAAASLGIGNKLYTLPAGSQLVEVTDASIALTAAGTSKTPKLGLGSVIASGAVSVLSGTATFMDYHTQWTAGATDTHAVVADGPVAATAGYGAGIALNSRTSVKDIFFNAADSWAADNTGNLTATGTITIKWSILA